MQILEGIRSIDELTIDNQRVLVRADLDVAAGAYAEELTRLKIEGLLPTLQWAAEKEARVIIAAHRGNPNPRRPAPALSLESIGSRLSELSGSEVFLPDDCLGDAAKRVITELRTGQVCLLENLRFHPGELANDETFARALANWCDVYVNDAFSCCHERYASTTTLPRVMAIRGAGLQLQKEVMALSRLTDTQERPIIGILGGAANSKRLDILELLLGRSDQVLVGGALAMTLLAAAGKQPGKTLITEDLLPRSRSLLDRHLGKLHLPIDVMTTDPSPDGARAAVLVDRVVNDQRVLDIGPKTIQAYGKLIAQAKTIVYTGAMGAAVHTKADEGTLAMLQAIASASGFSIVTGLESVVSVAKAREQLTGGIDHISLGADATLAFIAGSRMPGIDALRGASHE